MDNLKEIDTFLESSESKAEQGKIDYEQTNYKH